MKKRVLIINPTYLPGYKAGGPQQTIQNICEVYNENADIYLLTLNHDMGELDVYSYPTNQWIDLYGIKIMYVSDKEFGFRLFEKMYRDYDTILACGLFCKSTIKMMLLKKNDHKQLFVAPMGVFSKNALKVNSIKKKLFLNAFSLMGVFKKCIWSFTTEEELSEAKETIGVKNIVNFIIAEDLPRAVDFDAQKERLNCRNDVLRIIFLSRIVLKKNLLQAIKILTHPFEGAIIFDIYGLKEDQDYWKQCEEAMIGLPINIICKYCGSIKPEESIKAFEEHDIFLFPTLGENYGHVIFESLAAGCLPIISNTTPWKDLDDNQCGNIFDLEDIQGFRNCIKDYIEMPRDVLIRRKNNAIDYAEKKYRTSINTSGYSNIFLLD